MTIADETTTTTTTTTTENADADDRHRFPTHAAYLVPVEIRDTPEHGEGQRGVFAVDRVAKGTRLWVWTDRVVSIHRDDLQDRIDATFGDDDDDVASVRVFLRQGFVLPPSSSSSSETMTPPTVAKDNNNNNPDDYFHSNPSDAGRLTNHSSDPNTGPDGALRDILPGEELTMDYSFHGDPAWYRAICARYGVRTEAQIAADAV